METKRFIGNDMPRIYARVKREFGPDAVIVRTRSLLREGAEPLIEVLAAPPEAEAELSFELQKAMIDGALAHVQGTAGGVTVGELEDLVSRERELDERMRRQGAPPAPSVASDGSRCSSLEDDGNGPGARGGRGHWVHGRVPRGPTRPGR